MYLSLQTAMNVHMEKKNKKTTLTFPFPAKVFMHITLRTTEDFLFSQTHQSDLFFFLFCGEEGEMRTQWTVKERRKRARKVGKYS